MIEIKYDYVYNDDYKLIGYVYYAISSYQDKDKLKSAGMKWNPDKKRWETGNREIVKKLQMDSDVTVNDDTIKHIKAMDLKNKEKIAESQSIKSNINVPAPDGLSLRDYQKACVEFLSKRGNALVADEMGLGKTIEIIGYINYAKPDNVLIVAPKSAANLVWLSELKKWLIYDYKINRVEKDYDSIGKSNTIDVMHYEQLLKLANITKNNRGINIDLGLISSKKWDLMVFDESHYLKDSSAKRTKIALKLVKQGIKKVLLSGTPIMNKPIELYTQLKMMDSDIAKSWGMFSSNYIVFNEWNAAIGGKNLDVLQKKLRSTVMLRRVKADVLSELPEKIRQTIILPDSVLSDDLKEKERNMISKYNNLISSSKGDSNLIMPEIHDDVKILFNEMSKIRHETAIAKLPVVIEYLKELMESGNKIVVWIHHRDVAEKLLKTFKGVAVKYTGESTDQEKKEAYESFQNNDKIKLFIGSMKAAGVGLTLTAANICVFAELDWVPATITQAEDRIHRMGQKSVVQSEYLVVENTIDSLIAGKLTEKSETIHKIVDYNAIGVKK